MDAITKSKTSKQMLYISMISMVMMFAGLTSAYIISRKREDWVSFELPQALYISTLLIILSSISFILARKYLVNNKRQLTTLFLILTLALGLGFVYFQVEGFYQLRAAGFYAAGKDSVVSGALLVVISFMHVLHVLAGLLVLLVVIYNHFKQRYTATDSLGLELGGIFWHFVDILWIFLFVFFYFIR
jgi:cytochrome c oxidase subunit 3